MSNELRIIVSSGHLSTQGNGLHLYDGESVTQIDVLPCGGLTRTGDRVFRMLGIRQDDGAELLEYDRIGILRYQRCSNISAPHDILATGDGTVLAVSTRDNAIVALGRDGSSTDVFRADAPGDAWHLNCITMHGGRLYATAFGRFGTHRGWAGNTRGNGILFDVASGEDVLTGLSSPHSPRRDGDAWLVCDSGTESVWRVRDGHAPERADVGGFSRSICIIGERIYVGVSRMREGVRKSESGTGWLSVIDRETWTEIERVPMPCEAMYDVLEVDEDLLDGLRAGFRFGSRRERFLGQLAMFEQAGITPRRLWAIGEALEPAECSVRLDAALPARMAPEEVATIDLTVENAGGAMLVPAPPHPVSVCYRWFGTGGDAVGAGTWLHTPLPRVLPPGDRVTFRVLVAAPAAAGTYTLRVTLLQEGVHWFDDVDLNNAVTGRVVVGG